MSQPVAGSVRAILLRVVGYGALLFVLVAMAHLYVTNPLYVKKIPYFVSALRAGAEVQCDSSAPPELVRLLRRVSLPYFSLTGQVVFVGRDGKPVGCHVGNQPIEAFRFASMTKVLTALTVLELAALQKIDLHVPVITYFPEVNIDRASDPRVAKITLWQLLNHSSGLGGAFGSDNMIKQGEQPWCPYHIEALEGVRLAGEPGTNHVYSNVAYCLAGEVITRTAGTDYRTYVVENYLSNYESLQFVQGGAYLPFEPDYDFSNDFRLDSDYVSWFDFYALASSAGLMGRADEFALLVQKLFYRNPDVLNSGRTEPCKIGELERCYSYTFRVMDTEQGAVGIQQGYMPGASSLVAVNEQGEVLVWLAAGAALEGKHRNVMVAKVVSFLSNRKLSDPN
ncbi:serine hydrolase [Marinimicrobium sp. ABcell2]|uniref:serine hydrolase domain-containing protein n=1 Tax=Marinimicrobium sp. ABcell2 TaxID=3069751 RepID=UPI0027B5DFDA|nr:serine hydrolase domain-containing protein [Marinimicrobium sp. ABcell2]MDQ2077733.1 serine hydrolase domain-containing protein [Marinimicrobium sp. ABcell2]